MEPTAETTTEDKNHMPFTEQYGQWFFKYRDYTPIPLIILLLVFAKPSALSATVGLSLVTLGELVRIYSVAFIGKISRTRKESLGGQLVTSGPFAYVRNPLYVGNFFISFGLALYSGSVGVSVLTAIMFAVQYYFVVSYEEHLLSEKFGNAFDEYRSSVPPWIPTRLPKPTEIEWPDSFGAAIQSEKRTLTAIAVVILGILLVG